MNENNVDKENFSKDAIVNVVNGVIEASAVDDEKIKDMTEAMIEVLSRQVQSNTVAEKYNVEPKVLEALVGAAKRRLLQQMTAVLQQANNVGGTSNSKKAVKQDLTAKKDSKGKPKKTHQRGIEGQGEKEVPLQKDKNSAEDQVDKAEEEGGKARGRPKKDVVSASKDSQQRGKKRAAKEMEGEDKGIAGNKQLVALPAEQIGKRTRRSAQLNTDNSASAQLNNSKDGELASLSMALTLYKGITAAAAVPDSSLAVQPYSLAQHRPRRSSTIVVPKTTAAVEPLTGKKAVTWRDKTLGSQKMDLDETTQSSGSANKRLIHNPRWLQFPQVVEDVNNDVCSRMYTRNEKEQEKCANVKAGILDIIRFGSSAKKASKNYKVGESTIGKYAHDVKVELEKVLGMDVVTDEFLNKLDATTTTYDQLRTALNRHYTISLRTRKNAVIADTDSTPAKRTKITGGKPPSVSNNSINEGASSSSTAQDADDTNLMFLNKNTAPALLTSQVDLIKFTGTKKEFHALAKKSLKRYIQENNQSGLQLNNLASFLTDYLAAEYIVARRMERDNFPPSMLRGAMAILSRCIRVVRFTDVDEELDAEI